MNFSKTVCVMFQLFWHTKGIFYAHINCTDGRTQNVQGFGWFLIYFICAEWYSVAHASACYAIGVNDRAIQFHYKVWDNPALRLQRLWYQEAGSPVCNVSNSKWQFKTFIEELLCLNPMHHSWCDDDSLNYKILEVSLMSLKKQQCWVRGQHCVCVCDAFVNRRFGDPKSWVYWEFYPTGKILYFPAVEV